MGISWEHLGDIMGISWAYLAILEQFLLLKNWFNWLLGEAESAEVVLFPRLVSDGFLCWLCGTRRTTELYYKLTPLCTQGWTVRHRLRNYKVGRLGREEEKNTYFFLIPFDSNNFSISTMPPEKGFPLMMLRLPPFQHSSNSGELELSCIFRDSHAWLRGVRIFC
jgi:hypothetical protein